MKNSILLERNKNSAGKIILPDDTYQIITITTDSCNQYEELIKIFELITKFGYDDWPDDSFWYTNLPYNFLNKFHYFYIEELDFTYVNMNKDISNGEWEFSSWLEALKERSWEWWACNIDSTNLEIVLLITDIPERLDAFLEVIRILRFDIIRHFVNYYEEKEIRSLNLYQY